MEIKHAGATPWGLVTAAGIYGSIGPFIEESWELWKETIEVNLYGSALAARTFARQLVNQKLPGKIILLSGGGPTKPIPNVSAYCASKAAVVRFGETLAHELKAHQITVNSIAPFSVKYRAVRNPSCGGARQSRRSPLCTNAQAKRARGRRSRKGSSTGRIFNVRRVGTGYWPTDCCSLGSVADVAPVKT